MFQIKTLESISQIIAELDELFGIYNAALEKGSRAKLAYIEMLHAHSMSALGKIGLWMPREFFAIVFTKLWQDREFQSFAPYRQIAVLGSYLWLWLLIFEKKLNPLEIIFLKDQKARLFFLIPELLEKQTVSKFIKSPIPISITIIFDEAKEAYRYLIKSWILEDEIREESPAQTALH